MTLDLKGKILGRYISSNINLIRTSKKIKVKNYGEFKILKIKSKKNKFKYNGMPGGFRMLSFKNRLLKEPKKIVIDCIKGMISKNKTRKKVIKRIYFIG
ncbi:uL13 family ribosomal protein [Candidatus Vidania fulgoroideorum]